MASLIDLISNSTENDTNNKWLTDKPKVKKYESRKYLIFVLVCLLFLLIGLTWCVYSANIKNGEFQLTIFVADNQGNVVLENEGRLNIPLGNRSLNEIIGANGRTNFPDITTKNKGDTILIGLEADGWKIADGHNTFVFTGEPIHLIVEKDGNLGKIVGEVRTRDGQETIEGARVQINSDTVIVTDSLGLFKILLPEKMQVEKETDGYRLTVNKEGFRTQTQYHYPNSSDAMIWLIKL